MSRVITDLYEARYGENPWADKVRRPRGAKAAGLRYEKKVGAELLRRHYDFVHGPWIHFKDRNGTGAAQPDFVVYTSSNKWFLLESKITQTPAAFSQLFRLYMPLLQHLHPGITIIPVQVCKVLKGLQPVVEDFLEAAPGDTWHWIHT